MGEEEKKPEEKKPEKSGDKAPEKEKKEEASEAATPAEDEKTAETKPEESKDNNPPPPPDIVLRVYMHCEGCARKVRRCLKGFQGVEDVITDCRTSKVVVKGEKADPLKVLERIQMKSHRQVELISPIPKSATEDQPPEEKPIAKIEEKKEEQQLPVITVVLRIYMHCEACAQEIRKRIQRMKGVESAEPELKSSQVTVRGAIEAEKVADYVYRRTGKHATIVKVEPEKKAGKEEEKAEEKVAKETAGKSEESGNKENKESGGGETAASPPEDTKLEIRKSDYYNPYHYYPQNHNYYHQINSYNNNYPQGFVQECYYADPRMGSPQIFSDENPHACSVM